MEGPSIGRVTVTSNTSTEPPQYSTANISIGNVTIGYNNLSFDGGLNRTNEPSEQYQQCLRVKEILSFNSLSLARVIIIWLLFLVSLIGNLFVLSCVVKKARTSHIYLIMLHLTLADLAFTWFNMFQDAWWGITIMWKAGEAMCKICQILRAFGIYVSAYMVVVTAFDRCFSILSPMTTPSGQRMRTWVLLLIAYIASILCSLPAAIGFVLIWALHFILVETRWGVVFSLFNQKICPDMSNFTQCVDWMNLSPSQLRKYNFCYMILTMVIPLFVVIASYSLVIWEISNMVERDRVMMQRRNSNNSLTILRARRKTLILTSMVTSSFVLLWGPFYVLGIYSWFNPDYFQINENKQLETALFLLMYFHPAIHPFMYGAWVREVRDKFWSTLHSIETTFMCGKGSCLAKKHIEKRMSEDSREKIGLSATRKRTSAGHSTIVTGVVASSSSDPPPEKDMLLLSVDENHQEAPQTPPHQTPLIVNTLSPTNGKEVWNGTNTLDKRQSCLSNNNSIKPEAKEKTVRWEPSDSRDETVKLTG